MKKTPLSFILLTLIFIACSTPTTTPKIEKELTPANEEDIYEETELDFVLPSPLQIAAIFQRSGLSYIDGITHDPNMVKNYETEFQRSMNFGVYSADLSYCVLNGQSQQSINYLNTIRILSDNLGLNAIFDAEPLLQSFEKNINNKDSIVYILGKIQRNLDLILEESNTKYKAVIFFSAAWIEGMYIGTKSIDLRNKEAISRRLVEQQSILANIIKGLEINPNKNENHITLQEKLNKLQVKLSTLYNTGVETEDGSLDFEISDADITDVSNQIADLRSFIIK